MAQQQQSHRQSEDQREQHLLDEAAVVEKSMRAIFWALAETPLTFPGEDGRPVCPFGCPAVWDDDAVFGVGDGVTHGPACPINRARALVSDLICA